MKHLRRQAMVSNKKRHANRANAQKSTGPRTAAGKSRASRNAMRHGLASVTFAPTGYSERITQIANKLCEHDPFPYRYEVALEIAEAQVLIDRIRLARAAAIVRRKPPVQTKPPGMTAMSEEEFQALQRAIAKGHGRRINELILAPAKRFKEFVQALKRGESPAPLKFYPDAPPLTLTKEQQELEDFRGAVTELANLERYERRALSRRRRAIRTFDALRD